MKSVLMEKQNRYETMIVFYLGTGALIEGQGVCFDRDYDDGTTTGDATEDWGQRCHYVNAPSSTNNNAFAGVVSQAYAADASGQPIEIYLPGSVCLIYCADSAVTIGETSFLWCLAGSSANAGKWSATPQGFMGKGCARVMQTLTAAGLCLAELMDGPESGLIEVIPTATLTAGGAITIMVGGSTFFDGAATPASDCTHTLADGTYIGQMKRYYQDGALTTNDVLVTLATTGEQLDGTTDLATLEFDGDADNSLLIWTGAKWVLLANAGTGLA